MFDTLPLLVFTAALLLAALWDVSTLTIPNLLTAGLTIAFFGAAPLSGMPLGIMGGHVLLGLIGLVVGMLLFAGGFVGGGDAKLLAAAALWIGWSELGVFLIWTALAGGALAIIMDGFRRIPFPASTQWISRLHNPEQGIPYGVAIAVGGFVAIPETIWLSLAAGTYAGAS